MFREEFEDWECEYVASQKLEPTEAALLRV